MTSTVFKLIYLTSNGKLLTKTILKNEDDKTASLRMQSREMEKQLGLQAAMAAFSFASGGFNAGYTDHVLNKLTALAAKHKVNKILIEDNFGQGMFGQLLKPFLAKQYPCTIELVRQTTNKHRRILDTLEPLISQHRLVVDLAVVKDDYEMTIVCTHLKLL